MAGAIVDPIAQECFSFESPQHGPGVSYLDDAQLRLDPGILPGEAIVFAGSKAFRHIDVMRRFAGRRQLASAALALAWTAAGRAGAYVQPGALQPWDWAVGAPLVQAAGGIITDPEGAWSASLDGPTGIVAAGPAIHADVLPLLQA